MQSAKCIDQVRRFERMYEGYLRRMLHVVAMEDLSIAHSRALHELSFSGECSGVWLADRLSFDPGHMSRILKALEAYRLVSAQPAAQDGRARRWRLTRENKDMAFTIEKDYRERVRWALMELGPDEQSQVVEAMGTIERLLGRELRRRDLVNSPVRERLGLASAKGSRM
jgi:DNA-binding MarR family transcriptional regulator